MLASVRAVRSRAVILISAQHQFAIFPLLARLNGWGKVIAQTPDSEMFYRILLIYN